MLNQRRVNSIFVSFYSLCWKSVIALQKAFATSTMLGVWSQLQNWLYVVGSKNEFLMIEVLKRSLVLIANFTWQWKIKGSTGGSIRNLDVQSTVGDTCYKLEDIWQKLKSRNKLSMIWLMISSLIVAPNCLFI